MDKYVEKPYKHQDYPKMVFHPTTGEYLICDCEDDIPEGYVRKLSDVVYEDLPSTEDTTSDELKAAYDKGFTDGLAAGTKKDKKPAEDKKKVEAKKTGKKSVEKKAEKAKAPTLEGLNITRKEAKEILKEDGISFEKNASDDNLASKIEKLLKDDKSK